MSAVEEYRKSAEFADRFDPMEALEKADAAIAELEAENKRLDLGCRMAISAHNDLAKLLEQYEAEKE